MSERMNEQTIYWTRPSAHVKLGVIGEVMQYMDARKRERESAKGSKRIAEQGLQVVCAYQFSTDILTLDFIVLLVSWARWLCQCQSACGCGLGEEWREGGGRGHWGLFWSISLSFLFFSLWNMKWRMLWCVILRCYHHMHLWNQDIHFSICTCENPLLWVCVQ